MWYLTKTIILLVFACLGYTVSSLLYDLRHKKATGSIVGWVDNDPLPDDVVVDDAASFLLLLGDEAEQARLARCFDQEADFRLTVQKRRRQLIQAYSNGSLQPDLLEPFRQSLLKESGVSQEIEVEQALRALLDPRVPPLRVELTNTPGRADRLWRRLTLPSVTSDAELAGGPRLMVNSTYAFGESVNLLGSITFVQDDHFEINLGMKLGIGPGDIIQIERSTDQWIGTGLIESVNDLQSRGLFMGEDKPRKGDRALVRLGEE
jgi:hypothetical protein